MDSEIEVFAGTTLLAHGRFTHWQIVPAPPADRLASMAGDSGRLSPLPEVSEPSDALVIAPVPPGIGEVQTGPSSSWGSVK